MTNTSLCEKYNINTCVVWKISTIHKLNKTIRENYEEDI